LAVRVLWYCPHHGIACDFDFALLRRLRPPKSEAPA
jgi:hypothetical protein